MKSLLFAAVLILHQILLVFSTKDIANALNTLDLSNDQQQRLLEEEEPLHYSSIHGFRSLLKAARDHSKRKEFLDALLSLIPRNRIPCLVRDAVFDMNERALVYLQQDKRIDISKPLIFAFQESEVNGNGEIHEFLENYLREHRSLTEKRIKTILDPVYNNLARKNHLNTEFRRAALRGDLRKVDEIIKLGFGDIRQAFSYACAEGHSEIIRLLVQYGADVNDSLSDIMTPFLLAVSSGRPEAVKVLIDSGIEIDSKGANEIEAFHNLLLSSRPNTKLIKLLIKELGFDVNTLDKNGNAAVHLAAKLGDVEALKNLISLGADLKIKSTLNATILHFAVQNDRLGFVEYLLTKQKPLFTYLLELTDTLEETALHKAAKVGNSDLARIMLKAGADVNHLDFDGGSALTNAVNNDDPELVALLLANGANPLILDRYFHTLLMQTSSTEVAKLLIDSGVDINYKKYTTALECAAKRNDEKMVRFLIERGALGATEALEKIREYKERREFAEAARQSRQRQSGYTNYRDPNTGQQPKYGQLGNIFGPLFRGY